MASSHWPRHCYRACMAFYYIPTEFSLAIFCAFTSLTMHALPFHGLCTVLKMQWHPKEHHTISVQTPWMTAVFAQWPLCMPAELLLCCRRPYCAAMVTLWRPHSTLIRMMSDGVCFEHAQSACCRSEFYEIPRCCGDAWDRTACTSAFCIFLGRRGIALRMLLWFDRGFTIPTCY